jgi:2-amino-4-hydroxy-6-hydroxymethyldihydropteridine diphosphokinase
MTDVYIGVGSNIDPAVHIDLALREMRSKFGRLDVSRTYRNAAVGFVGEDFLNLVVAFESDRKLASVVHDLLEIELRIGKDFSTPRLSPQIIDLDLLLFGDLILRTDRLEIPRPETLTATYCLRPLAEMCPDRVHPTEGKTFSELWRSHKGQRLERFDLPCPDGAPAASAAADSELFIDDLRLAVRLGVGADERSQPQDVAISIALAFSQKPTTCDDDDISGTVDYSDVCESLTRLCAAREFKTIEHLTQVCFDAVTRLLTDRCDLTVRVQKCHPPIADLAGGTTFVLKSRR